MSTPPSNASKANKYLMVSNTHYGGLFSCTPKEDVIRTAKAEEGIKNTTLF
jgi:hypothetical protein